MKNSQLSMVPSGTSEIRSTSVNANTSVCKSTARFTSMEECWWRVCHRIGSATVVHVDLSPCALRERHAVSLLDSMEQMHRHRLRSVRRKREFSLCRAALRAIVCHRLGCLNRDLSFGRSHYGKPFALVDGVRAPISFNVSHSGLHGLIAVALAGRIGVDVEERRVRPDLVGTVRTIMSPQETRMLVEHPDRETAYHLYRVWTLKEALAKGLGLGFSLDLTRISLPSAMLDGKRIGELRLPHDPSVRWHIEDLGNAQYAAAMACDKPGAKAAAT